MKRYSEAQIVEFLKAIDRNLSSKQEIIIIGGTAATLAYKFKEATQDIDTANSVEKLKSAIKKAAKETGFDIPVSKSGVFDAPYDYESRLVPYGVKLFRNLSVKVPEAIDLIMMKMMRLEAHDLSAIKQIIAEKSVTADKLLKRFTSEMDHVTKTRSDVEFNFLAMIEDCFGAAAKNKCATNLLRNK